MNPMLALLIEKNSADVEAIVAIFGVPALLKASPHLMNIAATIQEAQKAAEQKPAG